MIDHNHTTRILLDDEAVRRAFALNGLSIGAMAKRNNLTYGKVYKALRGGMSGEPMNPYIAARLAKALGTDIESLLPTREK